MSDKAGAIPVTASRMDSEMDGMATGLSTCITKDGQTTTTAKIPFAVGLAVSDGTVSAPSLGFSSDTNTGIYLIGADNIGIAAGGSKIVDIATTGASITGTLAVSSTLAITGATTLAALSATTGTFSSTLAATGNFAINTNKFNVTAASGNTTVAGTLGVTGAATLSNNLTVAGTSTLAAVTGTTGAFSSNLTTSAALGVTTDASIGGLLTVGSTLGVTGVATFQAGVVTTSGAFSGDLSVATNKFTVAAASGNTVVAGTLGVTGASTIAALSATTGTFSSTLAATGNFAINTNKFNVTAASGNTAIAGTLAVTGATTLTGAVTMSNTVSGALVVDGSGNVTANASLVPAGAIMDYAGSSAPTGWLLCDGSSQLRSTYPDLFTAIGTTYGAADGTHFSLPDLRGRLVAGKDNMGGSAASRLTAATITSGATTLGNVGGSESATLAQTNLPNVSFTNSGITIGDTTAYTFTYSNGQATLTGSTFVASIQNSGGGATITPVKTGSVTISAQGSAASGGSGTAFGIVQPTMILNKIIKT